MCSCGLLIGNKDETNFVRLEGWYQNDTHLYIAMEYFEHGDLKQCVPGALTEEAAQNITFQVTEALQFMHVRSFAHRDLKPSVSHSVPSRDPC